MKSSFLALLLSALVGLSACAPAPTPTPQIIIQKETQVVKQTQVVKETQVVTVTAVPPPPVEQPPEMIVFTSQDSAEAAVKQKIIKKV